MLRIFKDKLPLTVFSMAEGDGGDGGGSGGGAGDGGSGDDGGQGGDGSGDGGQDLVAAAREAAKAAGTFLIDDWREALPEDIATDGEMAKFRDWKDIPKSYINAARTMGKNRIALPGEDATPEEWDSFFTKIGRPEEHSGYELATPEDAPQGWQYPAELEDEYKKWAHEIGASKAQAKKLWDKFIHKSIDNYKTTSGQTAAVRQADETKLKEDWGKAYKEKVDLAQRTFTALTQAMGENAPPKEFLQYPRFIRMFAHIGEMAQEDKLGPGSEAGGGEITVLEAKAKIKEFRASEDGEAFFDPKHPRHKTVKTAKTEYYNNLYKAAYPE